MKKNCLHCKHLEWHDADEGPGSGFTCNKRYDKLYEKDTKKADELLSNLECEIYLNKAKVCCELKEIQPN